MRPATLDQANPSSEHPGATKEQREAFDCGRPTLDNWLVTQAGQSMRNRDAATTLLLDDDDDDDDDDAGRAVIAGYYCLSTGGVERQAAPEAMAKKAPPQQIPVVRMGRLAVHLAYRGHGWGGWLLKDAIVKAVAVHRSGIGARLMLVDAIDQDALDFYRHFGFTSSPNHQMQVYLDLRHVAEVG